MKTLTQQQFNTVIAQTAIKPRLREELRFVASTTGMADEDWQEAELLSIADRNGNKGVLLLAPDDDLYIVSYELSRGFASRESGRAQPVICDFCRTWQPGSGAGMITFRRDKQSLNSVSFLCCADLACSKHVRNKTNAARVSRAQLREDLTNDRRIERLKTRLRQLVADLRLEAVTS